MRGSQLPLGHGEHLCKLGEGATCFPLPTWMDPSLQAQDLVCTEPF